MGEYLENNVRIFNEFLFSQGRLTLGNTATLKIGGICAYLVICLFIYLFSYLLFID